MKTILEISIGLDVVWSRAGNLMHRIGNQAAGAKHNSEVWSIEEEFEHMILSAAPIAKVLNLGAKQFVNHGLPKRSGFDYKSLNDHYWDVLGKNKVTAPSRYTSDKEVINLEELSSKWQSIGKGIYEGLKLWTEEELDEVQLKHPLLGPLTVREMLFFTHIHTSHHSKSVHRKASVLSSLN